MVIFIVINGFIIHWLFYNRRIDTSEVTELMHWSSLNESFRIQLSLFSSQIVEDHSTKTIYSEGEVNPEDLCKSNKINFVKSRYYDQSNDVVMNCERWSLSEFTDQYDIEFVVTGLSGKINNESVWVEIDSEFNRVFHFFEWKFTSIWELVEGYPVAFSEVSGITTPQSIHPKNKNITTAFKGP